MENLRIKLNFPFYCVNISYLVDRCRITTHWKEDRLDANFETVHPRSLFDPGRDSGWHNVLREEVLSR